MATTTKGFPYPQGADAVDVAGDLQALAEAVDDMPGVQSYTSTQINALTSGEKWAGRVVYNSTSGKLQVSNGSTFSDVDTTVALASTTPAALGVAAVGTGSTAARADHVHTMPSASDVGAVGSARTISAGNGLTGGGDLSADRTLSANFSSSAAALGVSAAGTATTVSRGDHVHAMPSASDVGAVANALFTAPRQLLSSTASGTPAVIAIEDDQLILSAQVFN